MLNTIILIGGLLITLVDLALIWNLLNKESVVPRTEAMRIKKITTFGILVVIFLFGIIIKSLLSPPITVKREEFRGYRDYIFEDGGVIFNILVDNKNNLLNFASGKTLEKREVQISVGGKTLYKKDFPAKETAPAKKE